jgi:RNA polymerase sigma factor (sigma-70 family)
VSQTIPDELTELLEAGSPSQTEAAWSSFLENHTRLILHVARSLSGDHDATMDRYAYVLERLAEEEYRRLREYKPDGRTRFTTWLVVVVRRLCLDHHRTRYGRSRGSSGDQTKRTRRALVDSLEGQVDVARLASDAPSPEHEVVVRDLSARLDRALADLSPRDRLLLALRFEDSRSAREIAELLGFPTPFHVYRHANRLLAQLRGSLEGGADRPGQTGPDTTRTRSSVQ